MATDLFKCSTCTSSYSRKGELKRHEETKHKNKRYNCQDCSKQFSSKVGLSKHINTVHKRIKYKCDECDKEFTQQGNKDRHISIVHNQEKNYACKLCDFRTGTLPTLTRHEEAIHAGVLN